MTLRSRCQLTSPGILPSLLYIIIKLSCPYFLSLPHTTHLWNKNHLWTKNHLFPACYLTQPLHQSLYIEFSISVWVLPPISSSDLTFLTSDFRLPVHLPPPPASLPFFPRRAPHLASLSPVFTWVLPSLHPAASTEAHISPPPPSPNTSCSSAFLLPTNIICCYGNLPLEGGGVLEHSHCWPWCGREMVGSWGRGRRRRV